MYSTGYISSELRLSLAVWENIFKKMPTYPSHPFFPSHFKWTKLLPRQDSEVWALVTPLKVIPFVLGQI